MSKGVACKKSISNYRCWTQSKPWHATDVCCGLQARTAARFGVMVGDVKVDFGKVMQRMRELRAKMSANDSAKRFAGMGVDVYQV